MTGDFVDTRHLHKRLVNFNKIDRERLQVTIGRITRTKVIQRKGNIVLMKAVKYRSGFWRYRNRITFRQLKNQLDFIVT
ncbi:Uncharacterised protein [Klebsiella variicola]|nr:Uncharacterised protein [Klebsiella variicola]